MQNQDIVLDHRYKNLQSSGLVFQKNKLFISSTNAGVFSIVEMDFRKMRIPEPYLDLHNYNPKRVGTENVKEFT